MELTPSVWLAALVGAVLSAWISTRLSRRATSSATPARPLSRLVPAPPWIADVGQARAIIDDRRHRRDIRSNREIQLDLVEAARWLGSARCAEDRPLFRELMASELREVQRAGVAGELAALGMRSVWELATAIHHAELRDAGASSGSTRHFTQAERETAAAYVLHDEVWDALGLGISAFEEYLSSPCAETMGAAIAGLDRIGAKELAALAREARARFGPDGPPKGTAERRRRIAALPPTSDSAGPFDDLDERLYGNHEDVDLLADLYCVTHPEEFGPPG